MTSEMWPYVGFLVTWVVGLLILAYVFAFSGTERWHKRRHRTSYDVLCDYCRYERYPHLRGEV